LEGPVKAVIPAAGLGVRFLPLTKEQPKEMLPVVDRPAIHWVVQEAIASGATDILFITGREKRAVEDYFDASPKWDAILKGNHTNQAYTDLENLIPKAHFHFVRQREPRGLGDAILQSEKHVGDEPFLVILGDTVNVADPPVAKQLWDVHTKLGHSVLAIEEVRREKISDYGIVAPGRTLDERTFEVADLIEKPSPSQAPSNLGIAGTYVLTPAVFSAIKRTTPGRDGEIQLTDALRLLRKSDPIFAYRFRGRRYDIGTREDWFRAHVELSLERAEFKDSAKAFLRGLLKND
jgi:UTP--glucose-1-phosphate uridylyltransferase